jgi:hypothetical protein
MKKANKTNLLKTVIFYVQKYNLLEKAYLYLKGMLEKSSPAPKAKKKPAKKKK